MLMPPTLQDYVDGKVPIDTPLQSGVTMLALQAALGDEESVNKLIALGADVSLGSVPAKPGNPSGTTPLMNLCAMGTSLSSDHVEIAKALIAAGADVNAKDSLGRTALDYAEKSAKHLTRVTEPRPLSRAKMPRRFKARYEDAMGTMLQHGAAYTGAGDACMAIIGLLKIYGARQTEDAS